MKEVCNKKIGSHRVPNGLLPKKEKRKLSKELIIYGIFGLAALSLVTVKCGRLSPDQEKGLGSFPLTYDIIPVSSHAEQEITNLILRISPKGDKEHFNFIDCQVKYPDNTCQATAIISETGIKYFENENTVRYLEGGPQHHVRMWFGILDDTDNNSFHKLCLIDMEARPLIPNSTGYSTLSNSILNVPVCHQ